MAVWYYFTYMLQTIEAKPFYIRPEDILTTTEAGILQLADRGDLFCPRCGNRLYGDKLVEEDLYAGIILVCLEGCGFREY